MYLIATSCIASKTNPSNKKRLTKSFEDEEKMLPRD
jgi:hypothetical protein